MNDRCLQSTDMSDLFCGHQLLLQRQNTVCVCVCVVLIKAHLQTTTDTHHRPTIIRLYSKAYTNYTEIKV